MIEELTGERDKLIIKMIKHTSDWKTQRDVAQLRIETKVDL